MDQEPTDDVVSIWYSWKGNIYTSSSVSINFEQQDCPNLYPANVYVVKVNNKNTRKKCEIYSKVTRKTPFWCFYC